jgi:predicted TIM-barrel fold metal-dependent hydrolase
MRFLRTLLTVAAACSLGGTVQAQPADAPALLPIFDAHLHYSHDAWERIPPRQAVALMRQAGLKRAMVSSSSDDGTQKLYAEAPDLVLPVLRPYRGRGEIGTWVHDPSIVAHLEDRLKRHRYVAIGEYHVYGADAELPVMQRVVALAREHRLFLHSHSDADAIERQFRLDPQARIVWAHAGFDPPEKVRELLRRHRNLWCDLAFRSDHASVQGVGAQAVGKVDPAWRALFLEFPDRFMVGTDTFTPERWHYVVEHARWSRAWLADLPADVAERIAWKNGEALFGAMAALLGAR